MNKKRSPSVLIRSNYKHFSHLERALKKQNVQLRSSSTNEEFLGNLRQDFVNVAVIDTTSSDVSTHELITAIKSISPLTEVIAITDSNDKEDVNTVFDNPLDNLVYAYIETPVKPNYLATLTLKAIEKQKLINSAQRTSQNRPRSSTETGMAGAESKLLSASVSSLNSAVMITDMNRDIIYINKAHVRTFGYLPEELKGKKSDILYPLEDTSGVSSKIYEALIMVGWEGERLALRKDGSAFPTYEKTSVIKDEGGKQIGIVSIIDDITKQKRLKQALKESEERYRTFVETAKSAIIAVNEKGKIILFNPAAEEIFGYEKEEILDRDFTSLFPDRYKEIISSQIGNGRGKGAVDFAESASELAGLNNEGEEFPVDVSLSTCKIEGQSILTAIIFDITERKNLEEQVLQSAKLAAVGELISGVTHEVNNPLAVVIGYAEMLLSEQDINNEESREAIKSIHGEAERARKVIQNLLSFARKHSPEKEVIQVNDILEKTLGLTEYDLRKHSVEVIKELDSDLPDTVGDPNQLQQVFLNLIINAQHAMMETGEERQLHVRTKVKEKQITGNPGIIRVIEISFEDNGPGIPEKIMKKIFDPFYTTKEKGKGTGLGLSVSFGIIKEHGGEIYARANEENGVTFFVDLPV